TSYVENKITLRMHCRRVSRLTNAFSKKFENFKAAVALHYGYYNFVKYHLAGCESRRPISIQIRIVSKFRCQRPSLLIKSKLAYTHRRCSPAAEAARPLYLLYASAPLPDRRASAPYFKAIHWKGNRPMKLKKRLVYMLAVLITTPLIGTVAPAATITVLQTFRFPGAPPATLAHKISDEGDLVGTFIDNTGKAQA